ncbi:hypothetical protein GIR35_12395 [Enterococcus faecalis]|nr:hypothetical protein GIR35_12395 [Enterococcus faecalis]
MEKKLKERIIFDTSVCDEDFLGKQLEERCVTHLDTDELNDYGQKNYSEVLGSLETYFDKKTSAISSEVNEHAGNPVIVSGVVEFLYRESRWVALFKSFSEALDMCPSHIGLSTTLVDYKIQKVWDENGHLFIRGTHHDGSVTVEIRQLTDDGAAAFENIEDAWPEDSYTMAGKTYDGSEISDTQAMQDLWENPNLVSLPRYMERHSAALC